MRVNYLIPAIAALGFAAAKTDVCKQDSTTIENQSDATTLAASCQKITGSIVISEDVVGTIALDGIEEITGDLIAVSAVKMTGLSGADLTTIGGTMRLTSLTIMSNLGFPELIEVGALQWTTLNALQQLSFTKSLSTASTVFITDTALTSLDGINLDQVGNFEITNNAFLRKISTQVANISQALTINNNGPNLNLEFPNLIWANNMTVRNVSNFSIPSLEKVKTTFGVYGSYMEGVFAPNLTEVGGDVAFVADSSLTNISMPLLTSIGGGLLIANNTKLLSIDGFASLKTASSINISGNFTEAGFPSLEDVKGTFNSQTSGNFSCDPFKALKDDGTVIKGQYFCKAKSNNVQASVTETSGSSAPAETSADKPGAAGSNVVSGGLVAAFAIIGAVFAL